MGRGGQDAAVRQRGGRRGRRARALAVALLACVAACSGGDDVVEREASEAPARTTSTTAPPPPGLQRVEATPAVLEDGRSTRFTDVVVGARAILVIGDVEGRAAMWTTGDGATFDPVPLPADDFPVGSVLADVVVTGDAFVVVGTDGEASAAWASPDGRAWVRTDHRGGTAADLVIVGELGVTSFGRDGDGLATWTSFDGFRWERVPGGGSVFPRPGPARPVGAYDDGDGFLLVAERAGAAEAWRSPDGRTWEPAGATGAELLPAAGPPRPRTVLGAGSTALVLGAVDDPDGTDAAVWSSLSGGPWERAAPREAVFGGDGAQTVIAASQLGSQILAVGTDTDITGDVDAVLWSSTSAGGWQRSPEVPGDGLTGPGDQHAAAITPTRNGALVVGWEGAAGATRAVAWSLVAGEGERPSPVTGPALPWQRVPPDDVLGGPGQQRLHGVVAAAGGFVAVGMSTEAGAGEGDLDAAVWRSTDGVEWRRLPAAAGPLGGPGDQRMLGVAQAGPGVVAVGSDRGATAVWTSADGETWRRVPPDGAAFDGPGDQEALAVAAAPDGAVVAVGRDGGAGDGDAAVWRSTDGGAEWARVLPGGDLGGAGAQRMAAVTSVGSRLVAVGAGGAGAAAWTSADGASWQRGDLGPGEAHGVVAVEGAAVAVGSAPGGSVERGLDAAAWRSPDGHSWERVAIDDQSAGLADQALLAVREAAGPDGARLLAGVGWTALGPGDDGAAWTSTDGASWSRLPHDEDVYGGDQAQRMAALAADGDVVVAVGATGSDPASTDAAVWVTAPVGGGGGVL